MMIDDSSTSYRYVPHHTVKSDEENEKILGETWETQKLRTIVRACTVHKLLRTYSTNTGTYGTKIIIVPMYKRLLRKA